MQHKILLVDINPIRTVSPQSHALSISGLAAAIKTPTLRKKIKVMRKNEKRKNMDTIKLKRKQVYLSSIAHVAIQFVDIMRTLKERFYSNNFLFLKYLAAFRASLPDWSLPCRSLECHIRSQLHGTSHLAAHTVRGHRRCGMQMKQ